MSNGNDSHDISKQGVKTVYKKLQAIDPYFAEKISETDSLRIERALGVYMETGKPFSEFHKEDTSPNTQFPIHTFILELDRSALYKKIDCRVDSNCVLEEVSSLWNSENGLPVSI